MTDLEKAANVVRAKLLAKQNQQARREAMKIIERFGAEEKTTITGRGILSPAVIDALNRVHVKVENKPNPGCDCHPRESCGICSRPENEWTATMSLNVHQPVRAWGKD